MTTWTKLSKSSKGRISTEINKLSGRLKIIMETIAPILEKYLKPKTKVIVGVSGGPDSIFLLMELLKFNKKIPIRIEIAHVNHGLRKPECNKEAAFVKALAKKNKLNFHQFNLPPIKAGNIEEVCRDARYKFFEEIRKETKAAYILVAHQADDNIETILFNLVRGSGLDGLAGMKVLDQNRHLIRPILNLYKEDILKNLKQNKITYFIDKSNLDTKYSRNRIRNVIIPEIEKINPGFKSAFLKNIQTLSELNSEVNSTAKNWLNRESKTNNAWLLEEFTKLPEPIQKNILKTLYKNTYGSTNKFNQNHLAQLLKILHQNQSNKSKEFGDNFFLKILKNKKGQRIFSLIEKKAKK